MEYRGGKGTWINQHILQAIRAMITLFVTCFLASSSSGSRASRFSKSNLRRVLALEIDEFICEQEWQLQQQALCPKVLSYPPFVLLGAKFLGLPIIFEKLARDAGLLLARNHNTDGTLCRKNHMWDLRALHLAQIRRLCKHFYSKRSSLICLMHGSHTYSTWGHQCISMLRLQSGHFSDFRY